MAPQCRNKSKMCAGKCERRGSVNARDRQTGGLFPLRLCLSHQEFLAAFSVNKLSVLLIERRQCASNLVGLCEFANFESVTDDDDFIQVLRGPQF
jgi:hypothetical protein